MQSVWFMFLLFAPVAWSVPGFPPTPDSLQNKSVIDGVLITFQRDVPRVYVDFSVLDNNPFLRNNDYSMVADASDCFANKLVFTDGNATFTPEYPGYCYPYSNNGPLQIMFNFDDRDFHQLIQAGFVTEPYPALVVYTNNSISEGNFPLQTVTADDPISVRYLKTNNERDHVLSELEYHVGEGILIFHFRTFIHLSTLNLSRITIGATELHLLSSNNSRTINSGVILTSVLDDLANNAAIRLNSEDRMFFENNEICVNSTNCLVYLTEGLAQTFNGYMVDEVRDGWRVRRVWPRIVSETVYMEVISQFIGYSAVLPLAYGYPYNVRFYEQFQEVISRVTCYADGINHTNPELFLNNEPIDEKYLNRNWPTQITLSTDRGLIAEHLIGYFSCKTRGNTFNSSHIIHYDFDSVYLYEGNSYTVTLQRFLVVPFAYTTENTSLIQSFHLEYTLRRGPSGATPDFQYIINAGTIPFTGEIVILFTDTSLLHCGELVLTLHRYSQNPFRAAFTVTINPPQLTLSPAALAVLPNDTHFNMLCRTNVPSIGTAWKYLEHMTSVGYTTIHTLQSNIVFELFEGEEFACVALDPSNFTVELTRESAVFRQVNETLSLVTVDSEGIRMSHKTGGFVESSYLECLGHFPSGTVDLYWTIFDPENRTQINNITDELSNDNFIATVGDNYLTLSFLDSFSGIISCKSAATEEEIIVNAVYTRPPPTIPDGLDVYAIRVQLEGHTPETFTDEVQLSFREATANATNCYCETNDCPVARLEDRTRKCDHTLSAEDVMIADVAAGNANLSVHFSMYVQSDDGILHGSALLMAVQSNIGEYTTLGFSVKSAELLVPLSETILTMQQIIGIAVGGGMLVILALVALVILCACLCYKCSRDNNKGRESYGKHQVLISSKSGSIKKL